MSTIEDLTMEDAKALEAQFPRLTLRQARMVSGWISSGRITEEQGVALARATPEQARAFIDHFLGNNVKVGIDTMAHAQADAKYDALRGEQIDAVLFGKVQATTSQHPEMGDDTEVDPNTVVPTQEANAHPELG